MKTDCLSALILTVNDDSSPEHKAIFHLWSALDDIAEGRPHVNHAQRAAAAALECAASALERSDAPRKATHLRVAALGEEQK